MSISSVFRAGVTAVFALGTSAAIAQETAQPQAKLPSFAQTPTGSDILRTTYARELATKVLPHMANQIAQNVSPENMKPTVAWAQQLLVLYSGPTEDKPLEVDGVLGPATAMAIIEFAIERHHHEFLFKVRIGADRNLGALRSKLQTLAPQDYIAAQASAYDILATSYLTQAFTSCTALDQQDKNYDHSVETIQSGIAFLKKNPGYISPLINPECSWALLGFEPVTRQLMQIEFLNGELVTKLRSKNKAQTCAPQNPCVRASLEDFAETPKPSTL